jgi:hypothetical protein
VRLTNIHRFLISFVLLLPIAFGQTDSATAEDLAYLLSWPPPFRTTGQNTKILWWAGDQAAVQMRKMYRNDFLVQPFILRSVLWILETAFGNLAWVDHVEDREPRAAISLLRSLQETVEDDGHEIAIDKLIEKLKVPETIAADFGCIDALVLTTKPIKSRKQASDLVFRDSNDSPSDYPMTRVGCSSSISGMLNQSRGGSTYSFASRRRTKRADWQWLVCGWTRAAAIRSMPTCDRRKYRSRTIPSFSAADSSRNRECHL